MNHETNDIMGRSVTVTVTVTVTVAGQGLLIDAVCDSRYITLD